MRRPLGIGYYVWQEIIFCRKERAVGTMLDVLEDDSQKGGAMQLASFGVLDDVLVRGVCCLFVCNDLLQYRHLAVIESLSKPTICVPIVF